MSTTTVRIPEEKKDLLKIVASVEKRDIKDILNEGLKASEKGETAQWRKKKSGK
jgi:predicted transcriptional regulator